MTNQIKIVIEDVDKCPVETIDQFIDILENVRAQKGEKSSAEKMKEMLATSMKKFEGEMVALLRECSNHEHYIRMSGQDALRATANRLEGLNDH